VNHHPFARASFFSKLLGHETQTGCRGACVGYRHADLRGRVLHRPKRQQQKCTVASKKPTSDKVTLVGDGAAYKTKKEAKTALKAADACKA